jgi:hypothetical protein
MNVFCHGQIIFHLERDEDKNPNDPVDPVRTILTPQGSLDYLFHSIVLNVLCTREKNKFPDKTN